MKMPITKLRNIHSEDIYVLGCGASMEYMNPSFFDGKVSIGVNKVYNDFPVTYSLFKHGFLVQDAIMSGQKCIVSEYESGHDINPENKFQGNYYVFNHLVRANGVGDELFQQNLALVGREGNSLFISYSTITSAIHLAAYLGARNIILCGHDGGFLDGKSHYGDYESRLPKESEDEYKVRFKKWLSIISRETKLLKEKIQEVYECNIYSLNPFINFGLEGHKYEVM